jgi:hypothetical protein
LNDIFVLLLIAYDFEAFVGNTGGYIGLFLGYALLQIPAIIFYMVTWCYNYFFKWDKANVLHKHNDEKTQANENFSPFQLLPGIPKHPISNPGIVDNIKVVNILKTLVRQEVQNQLKKDPQAINFNV